MKLTAKKHGGKAKVYDFTGKEISLIKTYDTKTRVAEIYLFAHHSKDGRSRIVMIPANKKSTKQYVTYDVKALAVKVKIPGSFAVMNGKVL